MIEHAQFQEEVLRALGNIQRQNEEIKKAMATQGQGLIDLNAAVAGLQSVVTSIATAVAEAIEDLQEQQAEITALQAASTGDPDPQVEAAAQLINSSLSTLTTLQGNITAATAQIPAPPAPAVAAPAVAAKPADAPGKTITDKTGTRTA